MPHMVGAEQSRIGNGKKQERKEHSSQDPPPPSPVLSLSIENLGASFRAYLLASWGHTC